MGRANRYTYEDYKRFVEECTNFEYELIEAFKVVKGQTTRVSTPMFKVKHLKCGKIYDIPASKFIGGRRCKCTTFRTYEDVKNEIQIDEGYIFNDIYREDKKASKIFLIMTHEQCGKTYKVSLSDWKNGLRCSCCKSEKAWNKRGRIDLDKIKNQIETESELEYIVTDIYRHEKRIAIHLIHSVCGHEFNTNWQRWKRGSRCEKCKTTAKGIGYWIEEVNKNDPSYSLCGIIKQKKSNTKLLLLHNDCGNSFTVDSSGWKNFKCPLCNQAKTKLTDEDMRLKVDTETNDEFKFLNKHRVRTTNGNETWEITIRHMECGSVFNKLMSSWNANKSCPECSMKLSVSYLHAVSALLFKKYYPDVEFEKDIGYRGVNGGISKYDLYIPNLNGKNTLIEFQSRYHDFEEKKINDKNKKKFAIDNGYELICYDSRTTTIEYVLKKYFKKLDCVPEDIINDVKSFNKNIELENAQELLDLNMSVPKIAKKLGVTKWNIYGAIDSGRLTRRTKYGRKPIVMLDQSGEYISEFESVGKCYEETGINSKSSIYQNHITKDGYYFVKKEDYESGNYSIPIKHNSVNKNKKAIVQLDIETNDLLFEYDSFVDASEKCNICRDTIRYSIKNKVPRKGFIWMYKYEYDEMLKSSKEKVE